MVEDSPKYYSSFLGLLYRELMRQSLSLYSEGLSEIYRKMYMMSRPKVLHARSFEEGVRLFERYRENVLAVICDVAKGKPRCADILNLAQFAVVIYQGGKCPLCCFEPFFTTPFGLRIYPAHLDNPVIYIWGLIDASPSVSRSVFASILPIQDAPLLTIFD